MKISYKTNFIDVVQFMLHTYTRTPLMIILFVGYLLISSYSNFISISPDVDFRSRVIEFGMLEFRSIIVMIGICVILAVLSILSKFNKNFYIEKELTISEMGIVQKSDINKSEIQWEGILKITKTKKHIFLYINQHSAHVIPIRFFKDKNELDSFYTNVLKYNNKTA